MPHFQICKQYCKNRFSESSWHLSIGDCSSGTRVSHYLVFSRTLPPCFSFTPSQFPRRYVPLRYGTTFFRLCRGNSIQTYSKKQRKAQCETTRKCEVDERSPAFILPGGAEASVLILFVGSSTTRYFTVETEDIISTRVHSSNVCFVSSIQGIKKISLSYILLLLAWIRSRTNWVPKIGCDAFLQGLRWRRWFRLTA